MNTYEIVHVNSFYSEGWPLESSSLEDAIKFAECTITKKTVKITIYETEPGWKIRRRVAVYENGSWVDVLQQDIDEHYAKHAKISKAARDGTEIGINFHTFD